MQTDLKTDPGGVRDALHRGICGQRCVRMKGCAPMAQSGNRRWWRASPELHSVVEEDTTDPRSAGPETPGNTRESARRRGRQRRATEHQSEGSTRRDQEGTRREQDNITLREDPSLVWPPLSHGGQGRHTQGLLQPRLAPSPPRNARRGENSHSPSLQVPFYLCPIACCSQSSGVRAILVWAKQECSFALGLLYFARSLVFSWLSRAFGSHLR